MKKISQQELSRKLREFEVEQIVKGGFGWLCQTYFINRDEYDALYSRHKELIDYILNHK
jgi:hypothetical protein